MVKNTFMYVLVAVFVGIAIWFFIQKSQNSGGKNLSDLATVTPTPTVTVSPIGSSVANAEWVKLKGGLEYQDVVIGTGAEARAGDMVAAHYIGTLSDGTKFDSSYDRGQPFAFILGGGMVIKGWDLGLVGMKVGGERRLIIPPALGYGANAQGSIPPNSTLFFEVELMAVQAQGKSQ